MGDASLRVLLTSRQWRPPLVLQHGFSCNSFTSASILS